jgi:hypothetical protein
MPRERAHVSMYCESGKEVSVELDLDASEDSTL